MLHICHTLALVDLFLSGLPQFELPNTNEFVGSLPMLIIHITIITFVGFMEAIAIAKQLYVKSLKKF